MLKIIRIEEDDDAVAAAAAAAAVAAVAVAVTMATWMALIRLYKVLRFLLGVAWPGLACAGLAHVLLGSGPKSSTAASKYCLQ